MLLVYLHPKGISVCPAQQMLPVLYLLHMPRLLHNPKIKYVSQHDDMGLRSTIYIYNLKSQAFIFIIELKKFPSPDHSSIKESPNHLTAIMITLCVLSVDMQNPLCAFHTLTVVSEEADITTRKHRCKRSCFDGKREGSLYTSKMRSPVHSVTNYRCLYNVTTLCT